MSLQERKAIFKFRPRRPLRRSFTLVELLTVMAVIAILSAIVLGTVGYVQQKGAQARAQSEIQALETACEGYKADNGVYPRDSGTSGASVTDALDARASGNPSSYTAASFYLYKMLTGDSNGAGIATVNYFPITPNMCSRVTMSSAISASNPVTCLMDPFGNSYGYSTANQATPTKGYNPTFDLWSTSGNTSTPTPGTPSTDVTVKWIKNW